MRKNACEIVFQGQCPSLLAADRDGLCVYDAGQDKIFHVSIGAWEVDHVLGTGTRAFSPEGLPPLSTNLSIVISMALGRDRELAFVCSGDDTVRKYKLPASLRPLAPSCQSSTGPMSATDDVQDALVPLQKDGFQPSCGFNFVPFSGQPAQIFLSERLPHDRNNMCIKWSMLAPPGGLGICLVADPFGSSHRRLVDCHILSPPEWSAETYITTTSKMRQQVDEPKQRQNQPFRNAWETCLGKFRDFVMAFNEKEPAKEDFLGKPFYFQHENRFEAIVEKIYNEEADCIKWQLIELRINGKKRAEALEPITVGVDVPIMLCVFEGTTGALLECTEAPKVIVDSSYIDR
ncbi:unnamed protein product [Durusdinium trenchii]|uniref:Uncharacterized protein n=2 Tax=Durusdinium trenchii TaxID=1381693 RepID=A0ABP0KS31_9DINO